MFHNGENNFNQCLMFNESLVEAFSWEGAPLGRRRFMFMMDFKYNTEAAFPKRKGVAMQQKTDKEVRQGLARLTARAYNSYTYTRLETERTAQWLSRGRQAVSSAHPAWRRRRKEKKGRGTIWSKHKIICRETTTDFNKHIRSWSASPAERERESVSVSVSVCVCVCVCHFTLHTRSEEHSKVAENSLTTSHVLLPPQLTFSKYVLVDLVSTMPQRPAENNQKCFHLGTTQMWK